MAWDKERTKSLLLAAATIEFCRYGLAGGRVDRIAKIAGVNKERIYQYFGKKEQLFDAVVASQLRLVMDEIQIEGEGPEAIADYAGRLFSRHCADPTLPRLLFWEGLDRGELMVGREAREANSAHKIARVMEALPGVTEEDAADLLLTIIALCDSWAVLPEMDGLFAREGSGRAERRRVAVVNTVRMAAQALISDDGGPAAGR